MRLLLVALAALVLAGCTVPAALGGDRSVRATDGIASAGWAYDGAGLTPASATLEGTLEDRDDEGRVVVALSFEGKKLDIVFDEFAEAPGRTFMDGGVAFDLVEHGDSGVADASIPKILATIAAWGKASVLVDGKPAEPARWSAHLMVSDDTVRGPDGKIAKADGSGAYDPAKPGDARRVEGDPQVIFWVKHPLADAAQARLFANLSCGSPMCEDRAELEVPANATDLRFDIRVAPAAGALALGPLGQGRLDLVDAEGKPFGGVDFVPSAGGTDIELQVSLANAALPLEARLTGNGAFDVAMEGGLAFDVAPFIVVTWDEVTLG